MRFYEEKTFLKWFVLRESIRNW